MADARRSPRRLTGRGDLFERELAVRRRRVAERIVAGEARVAVGLARSPDRLVDALEREVGERVGLELRGDLRLGALVGDHLLARRHVDAVVAGVADRRRGDAKVNLGRAGVAEHPDDLAGRVAADDRVVDDDDALAGEDLGQRVELHAQAVLAELLPGLDEGALDVAVLDQAVVLRQAGGARVAGGGRVAGVGHRDHEVGLDGRLAPEDLAHLRADLLEDLALEPGVGAREVDVLEDAVGAALRLDHLARLEPALADRDQLARLDLAHQLGADDVEGAALRGDAPAVAELAERERADAVRVAEGDHGALGHDHRREGAAEARHDGLDRVLDRPLLGDREERAHDLRVGGAAEAQALLGQLVEELDRVGQVAVVGERDLAAVVAPDRLRVLPRAAAGGRVADVADRHVAVERAELLLVEDLRDEPGVAERRDVPALARGDPGRLLAAVLERVEGEVGELRDLGAGRVHAEDAALVARAVAVGNARLSPVRGTLGRAHRGASPGSGWDSRSGLAPTKQGYQWTRGCQAQLSGATAIRTVNGVQ